MSGPQICNHCVVSSGSSTFQSLAAECLTGPSWQGVNKSVATQDFAWANGATSVSQPIPKDVTLLIPAYPSSALFPSEAAIGSQIVNQVNAIIPQGATANQVSASIKKSTTIAIYMDLLQKIDWIEGLRCYIYLDSEELATVGIGVNISNDDLFNKLKTFMIQHGMHFSLNGKAIDWEEVKKVRDDLQNKVPGADTRSKKITISEADAVAISKKYAEGADYFGCIERNYLSPNNWSTYPIPALVCLLDMIYNSGCKKIVRGFPGYTAAVRDCDWTRAGKETHLKNAAPTPDPQKKYGGIRKRCFMRWYLCMCAEKQAAGLWTHG